MKDALRDMEVLALDCQAAGATPAYGDLLEMGWAICSGSSGTARVENCWVVPRTKRRIPKAVRELTGWTEDFVAEAWEERRVWTALRAEVDRLVVRGGAPLAPTVIHYARFELSFLRDLHERLGEGDAFPFDVVCVHAIATRLFPDLPRRNLRALAGHLGHSPELVRRSAGHVEATAFIWRALVDRLESAGVSTWSDLKAWLETTSPSARPVRRQYPLSAETRRMLPDRPGVYRFVRPSGDVIYVGKATSLKKRVAGHFKGSGPATERALELLTQVHQIVHTETPSVLEAALLESDEIKRLDPPYNVQLRSGNRSAWFASRDLREARGVPDDEHRIGPLPSERALSPLAALIELAGGEQASARLRAQVLAVPSAYGPEEELFDQGFTAFCADYLEGAEGSAARRVARAALVLWIQRGHSETEASGDDAAPDLWDLARVRRRLERALVQGSLLVRRGRILALIADATVAFQERDRDKSRALVIARGQIVERRELDELLDVETLAERRPRALRERQRAFDASTYDRLRVVVTELGRVLDEGGRVALRIGKHTIAGERLARLFRSI